MWVVVGTWTLVACGDISDGAPSQTVVTDSAGVEIVTNGERGTLGDLRLTETLRLGVLEGEGPEQFAEVLAIAIGPEGHIVVGNNGSVTARVFDADGTFVTEVGGRGQGPAETTSVNDVLAMTDAVVIIDWQRGGKAVAFTLAGEFTAGWGFLQADGSRAMPIFQTPTGWFAQVYSGGRPPQLAPGEPLLQTIAIHEVDLSTGQTGAMRYEAPSTMLYGVDGTEMGVDWALLPETWHTGFDGEGRFYVTHELEYRVDIHAPEGLVRSVRKAHQRRPFTDQDVHDIIEASVHAVDTMSQIPDEYRAQQLEQIRQRTEAQARLPRPEWVPPIGGLLVSRNGSFWVERWDVHPPAYAATQRTFGFGSRVPPMETQWELFDTDGVYRGTVALPARYRPEAVDDLTVVGVALDDLDVEYVVRYEVSAASN